MIADVAETADGYLLDKPHLESELGEAVRRLATEHGRSEFETAGALLYPSQTSAMSVRLPPVSARKSKDLDLCDAPDRRDLPEGLPDQAQAQAAYNCAPVPRR